jgi:hypothetical protein
MGDFEVSFDFVLPVQGSSDVYIPAGFIFGAEAAAGGRATQSPLSIFGTCMEDHI